MPTRIVLDVSDKKPPFSPGKPLPEVQNKGPAKQNSKRSMRRKSAKRRVVSFRSSIFREEERLNEKKRGLSSTDIRASPRLIGYVYQLLASAVLLISIVKFYSKSETDWTLINNDNEDLRNYLRREIYYSVAGPVYYWKLIGCAVVGSVGALLTLLITAAHFETICFPKFWMALFRDGSRWEQLILIFMIAFWSMGLHVCTSSLSVGEVQGNVFFTSWIAFAASVLNYGVWRTSTGLPSIAEKISSHYRETTYNWLWLILCICIFAGSATDIYFNRDELDLRFGPNQAALSERNWKTILAMVWSFLGLGLVSLCLNQYATQSLHVQLSPNSRVILGWRHFEGVIILFLAGVFFYLLIEHSGVNGVLNGLTNAYFSLWGAFFNSVFLLGTWLRENKNIEYYVADHAGGQNTNRVTFEP